MLRANLTLVTVAASLLCGACGGVVTATSSPSPINVISSPSPSLLPGQPVPSQLQGDWFFHRGDGWVQLTLDGNQYKLQGYHNGRFGAAANGNVIVNADEIDFFDGDQCGIPLPGGVGRYRWTLPGELLHFAALNDDPCGRSEDLADENYQRNAPF